MEYTKAEIIAKVDAFLTPETVCNLYAQDFLNYTGTVTDGNEKYTEVIAARILERIDELKNHITVIKRSKSYNLNHKQIDYDPADGERREEERRARAMLGKCYDGFGEIIDYQTPLKNVRNTDNRTVGKIDLLSFNAEKNCAYILEYKKPQSDETLLRCILEAYTYWCTVDKKGLRDSFNQLADESIPIRKAALVYACSTPEVDYSTDKTVKKLMEKLAVDLFVLDREDIVRLAVVND